MESLRNKERKSKYPMIEMQDANQLVVQHCLARFPLGISEYSIQGMLILL